MTVLLSCILHPPFQLPAKLHKALGRFPTISPGSNARICAFGVFDPQRAREQCSRYQAMDALSAMQTVRSSNGQSAAVHWPFQLPLDSCQRLAKSLKKHWRRYHKALKRCQGHFAADSVHDLRVETRRLLSLFDLLSPFLPKRPLKEARCAFKQRLDLFDELRDTQVQLGILAKMAPHPAAAAFEKFLCKREKRLTRSTRRKLKRIKNKRLKKLITSSKTNVLTCAKRHSPSQANARLLRCVASALERTLHLREQIHPADTRTIHRTRVAFKHYRYMIEALAELCPPSDKKLTTTLHCYQTLMGKIQDAEVLVQAWRKFQRKARLAPQLAQEFNGQLLLLRQAAIDACLRTDRDQAGRTGLFRSAGKPIAPIPK